MPRISWKRTILWALAILIATGIAAPLLITLNFWNRSIAAALGNGLGRRARIGAVHPKLFGGLGFQVDDVVLEDDPRFGLEPFARIETLRANIGVSTLWKGRLVFSSLTLSGPHLNLVRITTGDMAGHWNVESLGTRAIPPASPTTSRSRSTSAPAKPFEPLPRMVVEDGRINYKTDDLKRVYFVDDLDMEITPATSASQPWRLTFEGRPKRTDFPLNPDSRFHGQATFGPFPGEGDTLTHVDLIAQQAFVGDLFKILTGVDQGVHGWIDLNLHLVGTTSLLRVSGTADMRDLHRWDRIPTDATKVVHADIAAVLDLERRSLDLTSALIPIGKGKVALSGMISDLFHQPSPTLSADLQNVPLPDVVEIGKQFTTRLDASLSATGTLNGSLHTNGSLRSIDGDVTVRDAHFEIKDGQQAATVPNAQFLLKGPVIRAAPSTAILGNAATLQWSFEGNLEKRQYAWHLDSNKIALPPLLAWARAIGSRWGRMSASKGEAALHMNFLMSAGKPSLTGSVDLADAQFDSRAVTQPLRIAAAHLDFRPDRIVAKPLSITLGKLDFGGSLTAKFPGDGSPALFNSLPAFEIEAHSSGLDLADLVQLLAPSRSSSFFSFGGKPPAPSEFFRALNASGTIDAPYFRYRGKVLRNFKAQMSYQSRVLAVSSFHGDMAGGPQAGSATIRFDGAEPSFDIDNQFAKVDLSLLTKDTERWKGLFVGRLAGEIHLQSAGRTLTDIANNMTGSGQAGGGPIELENINLTATTSVASPVTHISSLDLKFLIAKKQVMIKEMKVAAESSDAVAVSVAAERAPREGPHSSVTVHGTVGFDGTLDLFAGGRTVLGKESLQEHHWSGTLGKPVLEGVETRIESDLRGIKK